MAQEIGDISVIMESDDECSLEWKIPNILSQNGGRYWSPNFDFFEEEDWYLEMFPRGTYTYCSDGLQLFLRRDNNVTALTVQVTIGIRGPEGVKNRMGRMRVFSEDEDSIFWSRFCRRSELSNRKSKLLLGHDLVLTIDIKRVAPTVTADCRNSSPQNATEQVEPVKLEEKQSSEKKGVEELLKSLHGLLAGGEDCDVTLKVGEKEFRAHRAILRSRSAPFHAMFAHDMVEKQSGVVNMPACDPETFPNFLRHIYTGGVGMISSDNVCSLYAAADQYNLGALKGACAEFAGSHLTVSSFCDTMALAVRHGERELTELATRFFCRNAAEICESVDWQIFLKENSTVGNELFIKALSEYQKERGLLKIEKE